MEIRKVKWHNHPILGNLELDFCDEHGNPYKNIILAGENGTGKTTILETIATFLDGGTFTPFEYIEYEAEGHIMKAVSQNDVHGSDGFYDVIDDSGIRHAMRTKKNFNNPDIDNNHMNIRFYGFALSKARSEYKTNIISSTTSQQLDLSNKETDDNDDFTSLKQLIIDVQAQDDEEYRHWSEDRSKQNLKIDFNEFYTNYSKIGRFKNAFNNFFDRLKFDSCYTENHQKMIVFKKNGKDIGIDSLSTGEKQIVFRGTHLLQNINKINDTTVFVDEPEISMHPSWQDKILQYYQGLFTDGNTHQQKSQIFFASHSEHIIRIALKDRANNLVIVLNEKAGVIQKKKVIAPSVLSTITSAETNFLAFNTASIDYHIELYAHIQNTLVSPLHGGSSSIKQVDEFITDRPNYNMTYNRPYTYKTTTYDSLCTFIRNCIDHPSAEYSYTDEELEKSIGLMIQIIKNSQSGSAE